MTVPMEQARYKNNIDVSVGWVLPVLCMQCCSYQVVRFCGANPPPPPMGGTGLTLGGDYKGEGGG